MSERAHARNTPHTNAGVTLNRPRAVSASSPTTPKAYAGLASHGFQRLYPPLTWLLSSLSLPLSSSLMSSPSKRFAFMYRSMYVM